jgi:nuclear transport factor 2 (NTF2) superfamily protein
LLHDVELISRVYALFNGRDIESVLVAMHPEVIWANGMEGGHVHGRDEVRNYWTRQWAIIDPHVDPVEISPNGSGEVVVKVHQVVRDRKGNLLTDRTVTHVFQMRDGLIQRFDIRDV